MIIKNTSDRHNIIIMDFDFSYHDTQYLTHGFHPYPARMIPQIAKTLISEYSKPDSLVFDPFCGTGTTLVEAKLYKLHSIGFELNPLARLIAKVKTTSIEEHTLKLYLRDFHDYLFEIIYKQQSREITIPKYLNIDYWLSKNVQQDLSLIRRYINNHIDNSSVKDFFFVAFSLVIRQCSWTRNEEFKL
ncbi:DNA methyltransferase, partial [Chloroflexota bacterium]